MEANQLAVKNAPANLRSLAKKQADKSFNVLVETFSKNITKKDLDYLNLVFQSSVGKRFKKAYLLALKDATNPAKIMVNKNVKK